MDGYDPEVWDDKDECFQCGGEGYVYGCSWDWQCDTYDAGEGTCLCTRRCDICNPAKLTPEQEQERANLRRLMAETFATPQSKDT